MNALRSGSESAQRQILRRLHVRWYHASPTKMMSLLRQAGIIGSILNLCKDICNTCRVCRQWALPGHKPMAKTRINTKLNDVI